MRLFYLCLQLLISSGLRAQTQTNWPPKDDTANHLHFRLHWAGKDRHGQDVEDNFDFFGYELVNQSVTAELWNGQSYIQVRILAIYFNYQSADHSTSIFNLPYLHPNIDDEDLPFSYAVVQSCPSGIFFYPTGRLRNFSPFALHNKVTIQTVSMEGYDAPSKWQAIPLIEPVEGRLNTPRVKAAATLHKLYLPVYYKTVLTATQNPFDFSFAAHSIGQFFTSEPQAADQSILSNTVVAHFRQFFPGECE